MNLLAWILMILLVVVVVRGLTRKKKPEATLVELASRAPQELSARHCFFCGSRLSMADSKNLEGYLDFSGLLGGLPVSGYLYPFCREHDPLTLASPLPPLLAQILADGRKAAMPHEDTRTKREKVARESAVMTGQAIGQLTSGMWGGVALGLAGALFASLQNAPEKILVYYQKNQDLLLRVNLIEFELLAKSARMRDLPEEAFSPLLHSLQATRTHLETRAGLLHELGAKSEYIEALTKTMAAQEELNLLEKRVKSRLAESEHRRTIEDQKMKDLTAGLEKLKLARMAGILSEENYEREAEELRRKASA